MVSSAAGPIVTSLCICRIKLTRAVVQGDSVELSEVLTVEVVVTVGVATVEVVVTVGVATVEVVVTVGVATSGSVPVSWIVAGLPLTVTS